MFVRGSAVPTDRFRKLLRQMGATAELAERDARRTQQLFDRQLVSAQDAERARQASAVAAAQQRAADVLEAARAREQREAGVRERYRNGEPLEPRVNLDLGY